MASSGGDPSPIITKIAAVIKSRQKGQALEDAVTDIFTPQQQVPPAGAPGSPVEQPSPVPGGAPAEGSPMGAPPQGPPPDAMSLIAGLTGSGNATSRATTTNKL